ncbi:hypothetical protein ANN_11689 [Periplaneta americana]|uniref:Uncharacterized protein n=1 Tax=Periplaneta americana TaxID=6978 RepID=A0ABQ8T7I6_PERAM|nr:hypothetical protein ANN_11689 [Periplaneta americana]
MAGLCEGGNESPGSLKAIGKEEETNRKRQEGKKKRQIRREEEEIEKKTRQIGREEEEETDMKERRRRTTEEQSPHKVRSSIATTLRKAKWEVYEEVHCLAENGSTRRADIVAIDRRNQSLILDPTLRFEKDDQQANNGPAPKVIQQMLDAALNVLKANSGQNLNQIIYLNQDLNLGPLVLRSGMLTVTSQQWTGSGVHSYS